MQAYADPLDRLREALRWFAAVRELLLLHVTTGSELRMAALGEMLQAQTRSECKAAVFVLVTPAEESAVDWTARIEELGEGFALFVQEGANAKPPRAFKQPRLGAKTGFEGFTAAVAQFADALSPALDELILVLAPEAITEVPAWQADLRRLFSDRALKKVRFIVMEADPAPTLQLALELGGLGDRVDIQIDPNASSRLLSRMVAGMRTAPPGADGYRMAGMAGPKEAPPPRKNSGALSPDVAAAALGPAGVNPALGLPEVVQSLRVEALSASLALAEGRPADAVQFQLKARDIAERAGLTREALLMDLMLGGYLFQGGGPAQALSAFQRTAARAKELGHADLEAQALMACGGTLLAAQRPFEAADAYAAGARAAESQASKALAIECYRMVGQILLGQGRETEAATAWRRALVVAEAAPEEERAMSSAPVAAKDLAAMYRRHDMFAQADALDAQVAHWQATATSSSPTDRAAPLEPQSGGAPT